MHYPLTVSFKILALAPQVAVRDVEGQLLFYVKQKLLKLKEAVTVFSDDGQTQPLFYINADRVLDISARYHISDAQGVPSAPYSAMACARSGRRTTRSSSVRHRS